MRIEPRPRDHLPGIVIALLAGLHKAILTSTPVNDDYQHLAYARQLLAGDLPLRDFWDLSTTLQAAISAMSQLVFGHRLLSEAIVIGVATAVAVYLVFRVLQQVTGSSLIAALCAVLFIVAVPRAYAYPKWIRVWPRCLAVVEQRLVAVDAEGDRRRTVDGRGVLLAPRSRRACRRLASRSEWWPLTDSPGRRSGTRLWRGSSRWE